MGKFKVKPLNSDQLTQWELHLLEQETGLTLADYAPERDAAGKITKPGKNPPIVFAIGLLWLAARRSGATDITLEQASRDFEFFTDDDETGAAVGDGAVPKELPPDVTDTGTPGS